MIPLIWNRNHYPKVTGNIPRITDVKPTSYGYLIKTYNDFVTRKTIRLKVLPNGFSQATVTVNQNYRPKYTVTYYFDNEGKEIVINHSDGRDSTRAERKKWLEMQRKLLAV